MLTPQKPEAQHQAVKQRQGLGQLGLEQRVARALLPAKNKEFELGLVQNAHEAPCARHGHAQMKAEKEGDA